MIEQVNSALLYWRSLNENSSNDNQMFENPIESIWQFQAVLSRTVSPLGKCIHTYTLSLTITHTKRTTSLLAFRCWDANVHTLTISQLFSTLFASETFATTTFRRQPEQHIRIHIL